MRPLQESSMRAMVIFFLLQRTCIFCTYLSIYLIVYSFILHIYLSIYQYIYLSIYISNHISIFYIYIYLSIYLSIRQSKYLSIYLYIYLRYLDLLVVGSFMTMTSDISPNFAKYSLSPSGVVCQDSPPTNILLKY